ncbi:HSPB1-associated protein 1 isoform X1 [Python bivittatus]|uniref:HSPB1-associated protein 1 isoform X1 n=2 Tax=Python bivittatus TaxID=176946 RepID=A0A9F2R5K7_PYTBI|nr:HSPB1-associated protein 1 isoform X1 [Python bivittatus]
MQSEAVAALEPLQPGEQVKPFTPEEAKGIVMTLQKPAVFHNMTFDWPVLHWNVTHLAGLLAGKKILFRIGRKDTAPLFETDCMYAEATLDDFLAWSGRQQPCPSGPFSSYDLCKYWMYADYKYIARLFEDKPEHFQDVRWSDFGFPGRNGRESTLWIGSTGANTPCHLDSYGCNLVLQVQGRKRWHLYPPEDSRLLYPTRIPYEESSVFSKVNVLNPNLGKYPLFKKARAHVITLDPGQVLLVPRHWWHYVESIDPITVSVNSWIELDADHEARVEEAITRMMICAVKSAEDPSATDSWLNPTEVEVTSHDTNLEYLNKAVSAYLEHQKSTIKHQVHSTDGILQESHKRRKVQINTESECVKSKPCDSNITVIETESLTTIPFGQSLFQVLPQPQETYPTGVAGHDYEDLFSGSERHFGNLYPAGKTSVMTSDSGALGEDLECMTTSPQTLISTNDLLDCALNPQVVGLIARLLLEKVNV